MSDSLSLQQDLECMSYCGLARFFLKVVSKAGDFLPKNSPVFVLPPHPPVYLPEPDLDPALCPSAAALSSLFAHR